MNHSNRIDQEDHAEDGSSKQHGKILEEMQQREEGMEIMAAGMEDQQPFALDVFLNEHEPTKTHTEQVVSKPCDDETLKLLIKELEKATSEEEIKAVLSKYEELLPGWKKQQALHQEKKKFRAFLAITAALEMIRQFLAGRARAAIQGLQLASMIQTQLASQSQQQAIEKGAESMLQSSRQAQQQQQSLQSQLKLSELALKQIMEGNKLQLAQIQKQQQMKHPNLSDILQQAMKRSLQVNQQMQQQLASGMRDAQMSARLQQAMKVIQLQQSTMSLQLQRQQQVLAQINLPNIHNMMQMQVSKLLQQAMYIATQVVHTASEIATKVAHVSAHAEQSVVASAEQQAQLIASSLQETHHIASQQAKESLHHAQQQGSANSCHVAATSTHSQTTQQQYMQSEQNIQATNIQSQREREVVQSRVATMVKDAKCSQCLCHLNQDAMVIS